jgi:hypothetical protein
MHESGEVPLRTLAAMPGHADPAFTLRTYAHSSDEAMDGAAKTLANLFTAGTPTPRDKPLYAIVRNGHIGSSWMSAPRRVWPSESGPARASRGGSSAG